GGGGGGGWGGRGGPEPPASSRPASSSESTSFLAHPSVTSRTVCFVADDTPADYGKPPPAAAAGGPVPEQFTQLVHPADGQIERHHPDRPARHRILAIHAQLHSGRIAKEHRDIVPLGPVHRATGVHHAAEDGSSPGCGELYPAVSRRSQRDVQAPRALNPATGRSLYFGFGRCARAMNTGAGLRDRRRGARGKMLISEDADDHYERQSHRGRPVRPATFLELDGSDRLEHVGSADCLRGAHRGVI